MMQDMSTTYGYTKQVESNQQGSKHTLAILMSKLRSSLGAAWEQPRSSLEYAYSMLMTTFLRPFSSKRAELERRLASDEITARPSRDYGSRVTSLRLAVSILLLLTVGSGNVWGQTDYSGVYYIASVGYDGNPANTNNYYLCPTEGWCYYKADDDFWPSNTSDENKTMPFLTTYRCKTSNYHDGDPNDAIWIIEKKIGTDYYYIKQASTGRYLTSNGTIRTTGNADRMRVHLEAVAPENLDDKELFTIAAYSTYLTISPKGVVGSASGNNWLTINGGNINSLVGGNGKTGGPTGYTNTAGIIGVYTQADANAKFYLEKALSIDAPTITNNYDGTITIEAASGATIYYTTNGDTPTTSTSTTGITSVTFNLTDDITVIKAIAAKATSGPFPTNVTTYNLPACERPVISISGGTVTITCATGGATIRYTTDGTPATPTSTVYTGPFVKGSISTIRAIATKDGYITSSEAILMPPTEVSSSSQITNMSGNYILAEGFISSATIGSSSNPFRGTIDGNYKAFSLGHALIDVADGATIKNIIISSASIDGSDDAGAIVNTAKGDTKIYNCGVQSGSISGTNAGGLVGHIASGSSVRVVNCYNYANVSGNDYAAGIVGYNEGTVGDVRIAMCMMYGKVSGATNISPVYAGNHVSNAQNFTEYNYYLYSIEKDATGQKVIRIPYTAYNDQLAIDNEEYLTRYPFYRHILNNHRELASYFLFGDYDSNHIEELGHWVRKKGTNDPKYPIIEKWEVNRKSTPTKTKNDLPNTDLDYAGKLLTNMGDATDKGYLKVSITIDSDEYTEYLPITDMDTLRYDYNYGKVILPFANEYKINTDYSRICTGWKITSVSGGKGASFANYNFADRDCTAKDIYNETTNPFIYAQGGYYIVPTGVTGISIEANFATAYYLSDATYEIGYTSAYAGRTGLGGDVPTQFHGRTVYNSLATAVTNLATATTNPHKQAIVLVGNYHYDLAKGVLATTSGFTLMSIDADNNQEPDYGFYSIAPDRPQTPALRFDFVPIIPLGMAAKVNGSNYYPGIPIWNSRGWYEQTETTVSIMNQFELDSGNFIKDEKDYEGKGQNPCIINGGYFVQMIRSRNTNCSKVSYFKIGGNAYIKEFYPGSHSSNAKNTTIVPVNVTGGQVDECYMTGYKSGAKAIGTDIRFWCSGGKIGKFLGAYMDTPMQTSSSVGNVNMTAKIDHALIGRFFGGGTSPNAAITGDINITINNSKVDFYCGGPEFGNMSAGKTVKTTANNTIFGKYYGAGFGGTAITYSPVDGSPSIGSSVTFPSGSYTYSSSTEGRLKSNGSLGLATCYKFEFLMHSADKSKLVARFITGYAKFDLATTGNVTNELTGCRVLNDFYGAGCQGKVNGTVTSTLTSCELKGNAFGGGYKAENNTVKVYPAAAPTLSVYNGETGLFSEFGTTTPVTFTWEQGTGANPVADEDHLKLKTSNGVTMTELGNVMKAISLTIDGGSVVGAVFGGGNESKSLDNTTVVIQNGTTIGRSVYGGGNLADVNGNTSVTVTGGTIGTANEGGAEYGNVFGGGKGKADDVTAGIVKGNTNVSISGSPTILHNVYGGGAYGSVGDFTYDATSGMPTALATENTGVCNIAITGGTIGTNGKENGMIFGSSRGDVATPEGEPAVDPNDRMAWVYSTNVTIGTQSETPSLTTPKIAGSIYGSGENGHTFQNTEVTIHSGTIGITEGETITDNNGTPDDTSDDKTYSGAAYPYRGNVYGGGCGTDMYWIDANGNGEKDDGEKHYNPIAGIVRGNATVTIDGGHVVRNVYGAGAMGSVGNETEAESASTSGKTIVTIKGKAKIGVDGDDNGNVYGAARGDLNVQAENANVRETELEINDNADIKGSAFGGGEAGIVWESVAVNMKGGSVANDVYGGGALANTQIAYTIPDNAEKNFTTNVNLTGGTIGHNVYGGGLGRMADETKGVTAVEAKVYGKVVVALNGTKTVETVEEQEVTSYKDNCVVKGSIFGCNNQNGSPQDAVTVHIYKTTGWEGHAGTASDKKTSTTAADHSYHLAAVYGGGNLAAFIPDKASVLDTLKTHVIIDGCDMTSIRQVYGGGNAASVPATDVLVNGTYEIEEVFGGGNGLDALPNGRPNPGANVGYKNYTIYEQDGDVWKAKDDPDYDTKEERTAEGSSIVYGTGAANVNINGGTIHRVFGGSNTKGNVRITAVTMLEEAGGCPFCVDEAYGGGKSAPMDAEAQLHMACIPGLKEAYGGAEAADIQGDVTLNITNGTFDRVFGGNNISGTIRGSIKVNIEEVGCKPIIIGELYGGGNQAGYSVYGYDGDGKPIESGVTPLFADPVVNVRSFTSIGSVYGGGYGETAVMVGNPTVNINVGVGGQTDHDAAEIPEGTKLSETYPIPSHKKGKIGAINNVYGGGNAAKVIGDATVNIGVTDEETLTTVTESKLTVVGADIRGNVYGGGNNAEVTGDTNVTIGKKNE